MRFGAILSGLFAVVGLASCLSQESPPVHLKVDYQLRCLPTDQCFTLPDEPSHSVNGIDGLEGLTADCKLGDEPDQMSFLAAFEEGEIKVNSLGENCTMRILEGVNILQKGCEIKEGGTANCSGVDLLPDYPCQISIERDGDNVKGTLCCRSIPVGEYKKPVDGDLSLVKPGSFKEPASFEIEHCR